MRWGGLHGVSQIAIGVPTSADIEHFLGVIKEKFRARRLIEICTQAIQKTHASEDALPMLEERLFSLASNGHNEEDELKAGVHEFLEEIDIRDAGNTGAIGLPVKLVAWQKTFGGILPSRYYAIGGRPGAGKSGLVEQLTLEVLNLGKRVLFITREMRRDRVIARLASKLANVNHSKFLKNHTSKEERDALRYAAAKILNKSLFLVNPSNMTGAGLRSLMRRAHRQQAIDLVVVDYMQKLDTEKGMERFQGIGQNSIQISNAINETGIPALVVVQLNRESEKDTRRPRMSDVAESAQIERDADCIAMLWKDGEDTETDSKNFPRILSITKNRDGACDLDEKLWLYGPTMTLTDRI